MQELIQLENPQASANVSNTTKKPEQSSIAPKLDDRLFTEAPIFIVGIGFGALVSLYLLDLLCRTIYRRCVLENTSRNRKIRSIIRVCFLDALAAIMGCDTVRNAPERCACVQTSWIRLLHGKRPSVATSMTCRYFKNRQDVAEDSEVQRNGEMAQDPPNQDAQDHMALEYGSRNLPFHASGSPHEQTPPLNENAYPQPKRLSSQGRASAAEIPSSPNRSLSPRKAIPSQHGQAQLHDQNYDPPSEDPSDEIAAEGKRHFLLQQDPKAHPPEDKPPQAKIYTVTSSGQINERCGLQKPNDPYETQNYDSESPEQGQSPPTPHGHPLLARILVTTSGNVYGRRRSQQSAHVPEQRNVEETSAHAESSGSTSNSSESLSLSQQIRNWILYGHRHNPRNVFPPQQQISTPERSHNNRSSQRQRTSVEQEVNGSPVNPG